MPAAAVNPAPIVYTKVVAVKTFVVNVRYKSLIKLDLFLNFCLSSLCYLNNKDTVSKWKCSKQAIV